MGCSRSRSQLRETHSDLQRKNRPRIASGTQTARRQRDGDTFSRSALSVSEKRAARGNCTPSQCARNCLGAGRACQHGRALVRVAAHSALHSRDSGALGETLGKRQPGPGFGQGARTRAENFDYAGVYHGSELIGELAVVTANEVSRTAEKVFGRHSERSEESLGV